MPIIYISKQQTKSSVLLFNLLSTFFSNIAEKGPTGLSIL